MTNTIIIYRPTVTCAEVIAMKDIAMVTLTDFQIHLHRKQQCPLLVFKLRVSRKENPMENHQEQINEKTLKNLDISEFVRERNIKSYTELLAIAEELRTTVKWTLLTLHFL